ncbi:MAG: hypothetical protein WAL45_16140 [Terracidiphilus sp.]
MKKKTKLKPAPNLVHALHTYRDLKRWERILDRLATRTASAAYDLLNELNEASDPKYRRLPIVESLRVEVRSTLDALAGLSSR